MSKADDRIAEGKKRAVEYYGAMPIYKYAAAFAGVDEDTLAVWRKDDKEFSDRLQMAKSEFIRKHGGKAKPEFLLERLDKENFKESVEQTIIMPTPIIDLGEPRAISADNSNKED